MTALPPPADTLVDSAFLFRFGFDLQRFDGKWSDIGVKLSEAHRVPMFGGLDDGPQFADVRMAFADDGLFLTTRVSGRKTAVWCRDSRPEDSDSVQLWVDTRASPNIHRATRYCHWFSVMPAGAGSRRDQAAAIHLPINRARAEPNRVDVRKIRVAGLIRPDGYDLSAFYPASQLTGYDPANHRNLHVYLAVVDQELGTQTLSVDAKFPYAEDPSLWAEVRLTG